MNRFGIISRCLLLLAFATPACAVQTGAEDDEQTLESDVSSTEAAGEQDQRQNGAPSKRSVTISGTYRSSESFAPNQGEAEGPNPQPWSDVSGKGNGGQGGSGSSSGSSK